jgi:hypothetical protein
LAACTASKATAAARPVQIVFAARAWEDYLHWLRDELRAGAPRPDAELLDGGRAEGVARRQHHLHPFGAVALRELADGGGLARAVDADHEQREGLVSAVDDERLRHRREQRRDVLAQRREQGVDIAQLLARDALAQTLDELFGDRHAAIRLQQPRLELFERRRVDLAAAQDRAEAGAQRLAAARERGAQALEKTGRSVGGHARILAARRRRRAVVGVRQARRSAGQPRRWPRLRHHAATASAWLRPG